MKLPNSLFLFVADVIDFVKEYWGEGFQGLRWFDFRGDS